MMSSFLLHRVSPPNKLVVLNQTCLDLPTTSSEGRKWGDDEEEEVADNEEGSRVPDKGKAPMESLVKLNQSCVELPTSSSERRKWGDDCFEEEAESDEDGCAQITMDFREPRSPVGSIDSDTPIVRLDANILHPRALRMLGFTTKEGLEFEGMTEALTTMFRDPANYVLETPRARSVMKQPDRTQELNQACVELPTSSSERRKWGDDCVEEEAESDEEGYAQITMDFREPRSPVGSIDSDTPIVRLDANILHPRALRMLGFTTKEGLELEGMTEALTTMFKDPVNYVLEAPRARSVMKQLDRAQEVHLQVSSSSSFTTGDTGSVQTPTDMPHRQITPRETVKMSTPIYNAAGRAPEPIRRLVKLNQSCVELPTSSSERRKWGDDCVEEEAESDEEGYAQITMDFREPRSPVGSIDSDTPIVRLDANILHPRALRMLGFTTKEGLEFEGMTEALTTMFKDPADYVLEAPRARTVLKLPERPQEVQSQVSSSSSFITGDTVSVHSPAATIEEKGNEGKKKDEGKKGVEHKQKEKPFVQPPPHQLKSGRVVGDFNTWTTKEGKNKGKQKNHAAKGRTDPANETGNNAQTNKFAALGDGEENNSEENPGSNTTSGAAEPVQKSSDTNKIVKEASGKNMTKEWVHVTFTAPKGTQAQNNKWLLPTRGGNPRGSDLEDHYCLAGGNSRVPDLEDHTSIGYHLRESDFEDHIQVITGGNLRFSDLEDHISIGEHLRDSDSEDHMPFITGGNPRFSDLEDHVFNRRHLRDSEPEEYIQFIIGGSPREPDSEDHSHSSLCLLREAPKSPELTGYTQSEMRKWGDDGYEEEADLNEYGYAQITMDFREPRSPVDSIDSDTPIVRLDANILHPRALRMLGFTTKEGLEFEGRTEALTTMFMEPVEYVLAPPRARAVMKQPERSQEVHTQVSSSSSFTTGDDQHAFGDQGVLLSI
ncbi:hypothetical protein K7X08_023466 [Anisodus acutangulus]|uniref:Uncharacterized protein n=1 Tax=Anisodus acutangulus TaxID=402998 RepID=A0A9Q1LGH1_9SOLA|nr:hypothetical protein K7X08_023466 [Anisodus acutangulus]